MTRYHERRMISLKTLQIALFALLLVLLVLVITHVFRTSETSWIEPALAAIIIAVGIWVARRRAMLRSGRTRTVKKTRDSLLKWRWEERNRREW